MNANIELFSTENIIEPAIESNGLCALVVDDSKSIRNVISHLLKESGFSIIEANDGAEAIQHFLKNDIDYVVTDLHMPKMDGHQLLHQISQICKVKKLAPRILVSSADSQRNTILKVLKVARNTQNPLSLSFLVKPWKPMDLLTQTRNLFPKDSQLTALNQQISSLSQEQDVSTDENRLIIGVCETTEGLKIELGCDQEISLESESITEYLDSLENAIFCAPVKNYICCLSHMVHQSAIAMVTLLLLIRGLADKHGKNLQFVEATPILRAEVERQHLMDIIKL